MSGRNWSRRTIEEMIDGYIRLHPPGGGGGGGDTDIMGKIGAYMRLATLPNNVDVYDPAAGEATRLQLLFNTPYSRIFVGRICKQTEPLYYLGSNLNDKHYVDIPPTIVNNRDKIATAFYEHQQEVYFTFCPSGTWPNDPNPYTYDTNLSSSPMIFNFVKFESIFGGNRSMPGRLQKHRTYIGNIYPRGDGGAETPGVITNELYKLKFRDPVPSFVSGGDPYQIGCEFFSEIIGEPTTGKVYATEALADWYISNLLNSQEVAEATHTVLGDDVGCKLVIMTLSSQDEVEEQQPQLTDEFALSLFNWALWSQYVEPVSPYEPLMIHPEWLKETVVDLPITYVPH